MLSPNNLHILVEHGNQRPFPVEIPHEPPNELPRLRIIGLGARFSLVSGGNAGDSSGGRARRKMEDRGFVTSSRRQCERGRQRGEGVELQRR